VAAVFNQAIVELTRLSSASIVASYDFSGPKRIVDVGGGYGQLLATILRANPAATGVLFDLPHALDGARRHFEKEGLAGRCAFVAGDFFEAVPNSGDVYLLKSVIHDWNDERGTQILVNCCRAMAPGARLLLIEQVLPDRLDASPAHQALSRGDLTMLVAHAACERTEADHRRLLNAAGLAVARTLPAGPTTFSIIEALPREPAQAATRQSTLP
jgi:SAM-dependent methyltransferase